MRCGLPSNADIAVMIGSNIEISCQFNFNHLVAQMAGKAYKSYVYQLFIQGQNSNYYEVNAYLNGNGQGVKRFFLEDTFTSSSAINVMTSFKFELTLTTNGQLVSPSLYITYTKLGLETGTGISPSSQQRQSLRYSIQFTSQLSGFWSVILPIFIVVNIFIIIHAAGKTYIGYLNRRTGLLFFLNLIDIWSFWMFYFLFITTGYWFLFTKTTSTIYTFMSGQDSLYVAFYVVFGVMVAFRLVSVFIQKADKLNIQIFMINWEKQRSVNNSWREIFIANSLAQFSTHRTFSLFWILIVMLFFLTGLKWELHSREVADTNLSHIQYYHKKNKILLYFLSVSVLFAIAIVFKSNYICYLFSPEKIECPMVAISFLEFC